MIKLKHLAIIMDGNRRWARQRGLSACQGHYQGYLKVLDLIDWAIKEEIKIISLYSFSTENWQRSSKEVNYLMGLAKLVFKKHLNDFKVKKVKIVISGVKDKLNKDIIEIIKKVERETKNNDKLIVNICFNYGGRREILEATRRIIKNKIPARQVDEKLFSQYLFHDLPDPDIVIRTSGEQRLSNFLTWQTVYSELFFIKKYWPDFSRNDLKGIIRKYQQRQRRYGQ